MPIIAVACDKSYVQMGKLAQMCWFCCNKINNIQ
jgi:hypothetical protein